MGDGLEVYDEKQIYRIFGIGCTKLQDFTLSVTLSLKNVISTMPYYQPSCRYEHFNVRILV